LFRRSVFDDNYLPATLILSFLILFREKHQGNEKQFKVSERSAEQSVTKSSNTALRPKMFSRLISKSFWEKIRGALTSKRQAHNEFTTPAPLLPPSPSHRRVPAVPATSLPQCMLETVIKMSRTVPPFLVAAIICLHPVSVNFFSIWESFECCTSRHHYALSARKPKKATDWRLHLSAMRGTACSGRSSVAPAII